MDPNRKTVTWVAEDGSLRHLDLDEREAARAERGESFGSYEGERREENAEAIARIEARQEELRARRDRMVNDDPRLKRLPVRRTTEPDDDAA